MKEKELKLFLLSYVVLSLLDLRTLQLLGYFMDTHTIDFLPTPTMAFSFVSNETSILMSCSLYLFLLFQYLEIIN